VIDPPSLTGAQVTLTALRDEDSDRLFAWINDRELVALNAAFRPVPRAEHDHWFETIRSSTDARIFGIRLRDADRLVGSCQLHHIHPTHRNAELQIRIGEADARGRGVGTEAMRLLLAFGFERLDLHRIHLHVFATNEIALRLYEKVGMTREGILREAALIESEWKDVVVMAILRGEWSARR